MAAMMRTARRATSLAGSQRLVARFLATEGDSASRGPLSAPFYVAGATVWEVITAAVAPSAHTNVGKVLAKRRPERQTLFAVESDDSAHSALELMLEHHVSCVAVLGGSGELIGMLTLSDYLRRVSLPRVDGADVLCTDVMTPAERVCYVFEGNSVESCLSIMAEVRCHHLPVFDADPKQDGELLGVVSMEELLGLTAEARSRSQKLVAHTLSHLPGGSARD